MPPNPPPRRKVDFNYQIRPILSDKCFKCHGPDPRNRKAGLRLDTKEGAFAELESGGRAIAPGNLDESELVARITAEDEAERMPPKSLGRTLTAREIDLLKRWVEQGAEWKDHWSFIPPAEVRLPEVKRFGLAPEPDRPLRPGPARGRGAFALGRGDQGASDPPGDVRPYRPAAHARGDRRVPGRQPAGRLRAAGRPPARLAAVRRADGRRLARRGALRRHLRLSGRRLSRHVALARLGDQARSTPTCRSTSSSPGSSPATCCPGQPGEQVLATAFNRHHRQTNEGGSIEEEWRTEYVADRTITFGAAFLGLTLECSRCHSHKYDPITQKDFYSLFSFFNSIDESGLYSHFTDAVPTPTMLLTTPETGASDRGHRAKDQGRRGRPRAPGAARDRGCSRPGCGGSIASRSRPRS